ncbi:MAG: hypothetical protein AAF585_24585 [Verrucomicrobiota bacterium]
MKTIIAMLWLISSAILVAEHPIPKASKADWDFRGGVPEPTDWPAQVKAPLYECETYEQLRDALIKVVNKLEDEGDDPTPFYHASDLRLALIRTYYLIGDLETADRMLARYSSVHRNSDGSYEHEKERLEPEPKKPED